MRLKAFKTCQTCGTVHESTNDTLRSWNDNGKLLGWFFECPCKSTMFVVPKNVEMDCKCPDDSGSCDFCLNYYKIA